MFFQEKRDSNLFVKGHFLFALCPTGEERESDIKKVYLSIGSLYFSGGHSEFLPLANLNWIDDLVKSIAEVPNEVLVLFVVP